MYRHPGMDQLHAEAYRVSVGVMAARLRNAPIDVAYLIDSYLQTAAGLGIPIYAAWSELYVTTSYWSVQLIEELSEASEMPVPEILAQMGNNAAAWAARD